MEKPDYAEKRLWRNINGSQSYIYIAHPLYGPGTNEFVRIIQEDQKFVIVKKEKGKFTPELKEGLPYDEDTKAKLVYKIGEEVLDGFLKFIAPGNENQVKNKLEKIVEWCAEEKEYLYQEEAQKIDPSFIAEKIEIYSPKIVGYTQEGISIKFSVWNPGKEDIPLELIGDIYLGNASTAGGFVKNWKLLEGVPVFAE